jgi:hypothetical protein
MLFVQNAASAIITDILLGIEIGFSVVERKMAGCEICNNI